MPENSLIHDARSISGPGKAKLARELLQEAVCWLDAVVDFDSLDPVRGAAVIENLAKICRLVQRNSGSDAGAVEDVRERDGSVDSEPLQHLGTLMAVIGRVETAVDQPAKITLRPLQESLLEHLERVVQRYNEAIFKGSPVVSIDGDRFLVSRPVSEDTLASLARSIALATQNQVVLVISPAVVRDPASVQLHDEP